MDNLLPILYKNQVSDGSVIQICNKCKNKYKQEPCSSFYKKIMTQGEGFYQCPSGYIIYHKTDGQTSFFVIGIRVKKHCKKMTSTRQDNTQTTISEQLFLRLLSAQVEITKLQTEMEREKSIHKDLLHDVRKLDSHIMYKSDEIIRNISDMSNIPKEILNKVKNINAMEQLIACKYSVYDLVSNIDMLTIASMANVNVYKKFDKIRYILIGYKKKDVTIHFHGETQFSYNMINAYAEILPFLLFENAVKYTIGQNDVDVTFEQTGDNLFVNIKSFGPYCEEDELEKIFVKNYRGRNTEKHNSDGTGVGLYLVKEICNICKIDIRIYSDFVKVVNGIRCGYFKVELIF